VPYSFEFSNGVLYSSSLLKALIFMLQMAQVDMTLVFIPYMRCRAMICCTPNCKSEKVDISMLF
jgi:hypothetical protein